MSTTMAQLVADEAAFEAYLATLEHEPEEDLDDWEMDRRRHNTLTIGGEEFSDVRFTHGGSIGAVRLA